jgi:hypothetical protein
MKGDVLGNIGHSFFLKEQALFFLKKGAKNTKNTNLQVRMEWWAPGAAATLDPAANGGLEVFVVAGEVEVDGEGFGEWSWLRFPAAGGGAIARTVKNASERESSIWVKTGHLRL